MASTWSSGGLNLRLMTTGENDNTWGDQTNDNLKRLENKITGYAAVTLSGATHTLTFTDNPTSYADEDGRNFVLNFGGSPGGTCTVTIPARETVYLVLNNTADSNTITLTTGSGTTFNVPAGKDAFVYSDGTNVYNAMADAIFTTITGDGSALTGVLHDVVDDTTPQLGGNLDTNGNDINYGDNDKAQFGASQDLQIYHDGSHSYIKDNGTGNLTLSGTNLYLTTTNAQIYLSAITDGAVGLYYDNAEKIVTTSTGVNVTGTVTADGVDLGDNEKIRLGASQDLEIYHNGSNSYIDDVGTGSMFIRADDYVLIDKSDGSKRSASFNTDDAVILYFNNNQKFTTTSGGATVTGTLTADGISLGDNENLSIGASGDLKMFHDGVGGNSYIQDAGTGDLYLDFSDDFIIRKFASAEVVAQFNSDGAVELYYDNSKKFETTSSGVTVTGTGTFSGAGSFEALELITSDTNRVYVTGNSSVSGDMWRIGTSASNPYLNIDGLQASSGILFRTGGTNERMRIDSSGNVGIGTSSPATPLHIYNANAILRLQDTVDGTPAAPSIQFWDSNSQMSAIGYLSSSNNDLDIFQTENAAIDFWTNSTQRMRIDSSGNVIFKNGALLEEGTLTDGATIAWDVNASPVAKVTLGGNRTISAPSNSAGAGQFISLLVIQDATGSRTLTWNAAYEFKDDTAPTLTTTAQKADLFTFRYNGTKWLEVGRNTNLSIS